MTGSVISVQNQGAPSRDGGFYASGSPRATMRPENGIYVGLQCSPHFSPRATGLTDAPLSGRMTRAGRELDASIEAAVEQLNHQFRRVLGGHQSHVSMTGQKALLSVDFQCSPATPENSMLEKIRERFKQKVSQTYAEVGMQWMSSLTIDIAIVRPDRSGIRQSRVQVNVTVGGYAYMPMLNEPVLPSAPAAAAPHASCSSAVALISATECSVTPSQGEIMRTLQRAKAAEGGPKGPEARRIINTFRIDRMRNKQVDAVQQPAHVASDILHRFNIAVAEAGLALSPRRIRRQTRE